MLSHLENDLQCDLAFDDRLRVITVNERIFKDKNVTSGAFAPDWLFNPVTKNADIARLRESKIGEGKVFLRLFVDPQDEVGRWFSAYPIVHSGAHVIALHAVKLRWDDKCTEPFREAFKLTATELELTKHLVRGQSTREFAESRGRSIATVRKQLKALNRKLSINSKEQLLLLYAGFVFSLNPTDETVEDVDHECPFLFCDSQNRPVAWEEYGDPNGLPVLFFHGVEGALLTSQVDQSARTAGLRIIAPWRPFYGGTTGEEHGLKSPLLFAHRMAALLDHLHIERCAALSTQAGTPYLAAFVQAYPERVHRAVAAGPFLPIVEAQDYRYFKPRQRIHFKIARLTPAFVRVYMRAVLASIGTGNFHKFIEAFYHDCPRELAILRRPEMVRNFRKAASYVLPFGTMGPSDTMLNWAASWETLLQGLGPQLMMLVGDKDANMSIEFAQLTADRFGLEEPVIIPNGCSFLIEDQPNTVFKHVRAAFDA